MTDPSTLTGSSNALNPYAPPQASIAPGLGDAPEDAEAIRRQLLSHETSIRGIGGLYVFGAILMGIAAVAILLGSLVSSEISGAMAAVAVFYGLFAWISYYLGSGLRRLDPKVRLGTTILAVIGLLGIPVGTLINGYILYLLHSEKGKRVMTTEYQTVVAQTPHIKYRTPLWLIILALLLVALIVFAVVMAMQS